MGIPKKQKVLSVKVTVEEVVEDEQGVQTSHMMVFDLQPGAVITQKRSLMVAEALGTDQEQWPKVQKGDPVFVPAPTASLEIKGDILLEGEHRFPPYDPATLKPYV